MQKPRFPAFMRPGRNARRRSKHQQFDAYERMAAIYLLRLALGLKNDLKRVPLLAYFVNELGELTGLAINESELEDDDDVKSRSSFIDASKTELLRHIRVRLDQLLAEGIDPTMPLFENIKLLAQTLKLNGIEQEILSLRLLMILLEPFREKVSRHCRSCTMQLAIEYLRIMTTQSAADIRKALQPNGLLGQMGWLTIETGLVDLEDKLSLTDNLYEILFREHNNADDLLANFYQAVKPTNLVLADYAHLQTDLDVVLPYLKTALQRKQAGVNILIYGSPGVGKTELVKLMAQTLNARLYEVKCTDQNGEALSGKSRFTAANVSQKIISHNREHSLIMFDEAEDVFPRSFSFSFLFGQDEDDDENSNGDKAWINKQLETNPVPVIWISNRVAHIDKAYLRRFSYSLEINKMPAPIRHRIINKYSKGLKVSADWRDNLAKQEQLTPAQIENATRIARSTQKQSPAHCEQIADRVLAASMRLLNQKPCPQAQTGWTKYDPPFTNIDFDINTVITGLKQRPRGNFCFYGAPGTGKTALARHIAEALNLPLHIKRASDLIDKYVGESEKNIALMFADAHKQGAILLLDEADSFFGDRNHAQRQWEVTQVNEMLTQMESYHGIFICTTNLMEKLDAAALRRFDFKVKFDYLNPQQRWALFQQECSRLGGHLPDMPEELSILKHNIKCLTKLTPGDFAVFSRQVALLGVKPEPEKMIAVLEQECKAKGENFSRIGFVR